MFEQTADLIKNKTQTPYDIQDSFKNGSVYKM